MSATEHTFEARGTRFNVVTAPVTSGLLVALPEWNWCCTLGLPVGPGWLREHGLKNRVDADTLAGWLRVNWGLLTGEVSRVD